MERRDLSHLFVSLQFQFECLLLLPFFFAPFHFPFLPLMVKRGRPDSRRLPSGIRREIEKRFSWTELGTTGAMTGPREELIVLSLSLLHTGGKWSRLLSSSGGAEVKRPHQGKVNV